MAASGLFEQCFERKFPERFQKLGSGTHWSRCNRISEVEFRMPDLGVKQSRTRAFTELTELNYLLHNNVLMAKRTFPGPSPRGVED